MLSYASIGDRETVFDVVLDGGLEIIGAETGQLMLIEANELVIRASRPTGELDVRYMLDDSVTGWVVQHKQALNINDTTTDERFKHLYKHGETGPMKSELAVPLMLAGDVIGILNAENPNENAFTDRHWDLWTILATQATVSIDIAQRFIEQQTCE